MLLIRNRDEYREYLILMKRGVTTQLEHATKQKEIAHLKGQLYGLQLALDGLKDWEAQDAGKMSQ